MEKPNCEICDDLGIVPFPTFIPEEGEIEFDSEDCECQKNNEGIDTQNAYYKTFKDLNFVPHSVMPGLQALMFFSNGYGVSVVRFKSFGRYGSYTNDETEWELAVIKGDKDKWGITYETPVTNDVLGYLKENDVTETMIKIQQLTRALNN